MECLIPPLECLQISAFNTISVKSVRHVSHSLGLAKNFRVYYGAARPYLSS